MLTSARTILIVLFVLTCCGLPAWAQGARPTSSADRLFLAFIEDATIVDSQWWEGQVGIAEFDGFDATTIRGIAAFQPMQDFEFGGRVGFGSTDANDGGMDGSGATDLDLWTKYHLGGGADTEFAVGGVATIPTGDDSAGLGFDSFGISAFGALRHRLEKVIVTAHAGFQFNGDGAFRGSPDVDGETAPMVGAGVIVPFSDTLTGVAEAIFRDGRLEGADSDVRALAGINWRPGGRGTFRAALGFGFDDGAPDVELWAGYASQF